MALETRANELVAVEVQGDASVERACFGGHSDFSDVKSRDKKALTRDTMFLDTHK